MIKMPSTPQASGTDLATGLTSAQGLDLNQFDPIQTHVQSWTTEAGSRVRYVEARGLPIIDLVLRFDAGTAYDGLKPGLAALTLYMLDEGSQGLSAAEHAGRLEALGAVVTKDIGLDHATLSLRSLTHQALLGPVIDLFTSLAAQPNLSASALATVKGQTLKFHASKNSAPQQRAIAETYRHMFRAHPYGNLVGSTPEGIDAITVDDLRHFHQHAYSATNLEITLVGDLSPTQAQHISQRISQALPQGWAAAQLPAVPEVAGTTISVEHRGASNAVVLALPINVPTNSPEYFALRVAGRVLTSGLESRLMAELRERRGLTYGVNSELSSLKAGGLFTINWDIASELVESSQRLVTAMLRTFVEEGPTHTELSRACRQLNGLLLRSVAQNSSLAFIVAKAGAQGQPDDYLKRQTERLRELTPGVIREVLQRRLDLARLTSINVGPIVDQKPLPEPPATDQ